MNKLLISLFISLLITTGCEIPHFEPQDIQEEQEHEHENEEDHENEDEQDNDDSDD